MDEINKLKSQTYTIINHVDEIEKYLTIVNYLKNYIFQSRN